MLTQWVVMVLNCNVLYHLQQCKCPGQDLWAPLHGIYTDSFTPPLCVQQQNNASCSCSSQGQTLSVCLSDPTSRLLVNNEGAKPALLVRGLIPV